MILISSQGGTATTMFIKWLEKKYITNCRKNRDNLKHPSNPPQSNKIKKAIYIYDRPEYQATSLVERFKAKQIEVLTGQIIGDIETPIDLLKYDHDLFNFEKILKNWLYNDYVKYDILFVKYENMWNNLQNIIEFLEINQSMIKNFPKKLKERNTYKILNENPELKTHLQKIYENYNNFIDNLPDLYLKETSKK